MYLCICTCLNWYIDCVKIAFETDGAFRARFGSHGCCGFNIPLCMSQELFSWLPYGLLDLHIGHWPLLFHLAHLHLASTNLLYSA